MECDKEETIATQRMNLKEKKTIMKLLDECEKNGYSVTIYRTDVETIKRALNCYGRTIKRKSDLEKVVDTCIEPFYWEKERYAIGTLEYVLYGKEITSEYIAKKQKDEKEGEER